MKFSALAKGFQRTTSRRASRVAVLASALTVLLGFTTFAVASASPYQTVQLARASIQARYTQFGGAQSTLSTFDSFSPGRHHGGGNFGSSTTTTVAPSPTTTIAPTPTSTTTLGPVATTSTTSTTSAPATTTTVAPVTTTTAAPVTTTTAATAFPVGTADSSEPSGMAPPSASALSGYSQSYVTDFSGSSLPSGWYTYSGQPGGDPGAQWAPGHVQVSGGLLQLNTYQDSSYGGEWVSGGLCQCGHAQAYGAYFVRARLTGAGPTGVMLLWPSANVWPPEVDFNETGGGVSGTSATVHYSSTNKQDQRSLSIDMTKWHTWGVIWTPTSITYTVDGRVWGTVTNTAEIPSIAMTLDLQQQTWCSSGWACPSAPQSMQVDWVAEYTAA